MFFDHDAVNGPGAPYNRVAAYYDRRYKGSLDRYFRTMADDWIAQEVGPSPRSLLDIGTGTGRLFDLAKPDRFLAIDLSLDMLRAARMRGLGRAGHFAAMDARYLAVQACWADVVTALGTFEWFRDLRPVLREVRRVLKPEGIFLFSVWNDRRWWRSWPFEIPGRREATHRLDLLTPVLNSEGFELLDKRYTLFLPRRIFWICHRLLSCDALRNCLYRLDQRLLALSQQWPALKKSAGMLVIKTCRRSTPQP